MRINVKKYFQVLGIVLGVMFALFMVGMGFDFTGLIPEDADHNGNGTVAVEPGGTINVLVMCTDEDGLRTDAMMLASYNTEKNTINILSIPRDMRMYIGNRYQKVNAAHAFMTDNVPAGAEGACEAISRLTGVPINYYVDFTFDAVAHVIDELGTVNYTIPDLYGDGVGMVYDDPVQGLHINLPPGNMDLNGAQVVQLLRYRKGNVDPATGRYKSYLNGDTDRIKVQQDFLRTFIDQKLKVSSISKLPSIFTDIKKEMKTNLTVRDVMKYSRYLKDFSSADLNSSTIPGDPMDESSNGSVLVPNMKQLQHLVMDMFGTAGDNMWYAQPGLVPEFYSSGYYTTGGYVRSTDKGVLAGIKAHNLTNDELCILKGVVQSDAPIVTPSSEGFSTGEDTGEADGAVYGQ